VVLPLADGEAGFLPGAAPMIGRLGAGELRIRNDGKEDRYFVDGGFAQIEDGVLSVLPGRSVSAADITLAAAEESLKEALALPSDQPALNEVKHPTYQHTIAQDSQAGSLRHQPPEAILISS